MTKINGDKNLVIELNLQFNKTTFNNCYVTDSANIYLFRVNNRKH